MKSIGNHSAAGQHNLRGKKTKLLRCGCCVIQDFRDDYEEKWARREMRDSRDAGPKETRP